MTTHSPMWSGLTLHSEPSLWAFPIHLTGPHSPLGQRRTSATFWQGRTISFSPLTLLPFAPAARSPARAGGTHQDRQHENCFAGINVLAHSPKPPFIAIAANSSSLIAGASLFAGPDQRKRNDDGDSGYRNKQWRMEEIVRKPNGSGIQTEKGYS